MYGAILGDMIGAPYEFDRGGKTKDFPLFTEKSSYTDDTIMTVAVAEALLEVQNGVQTETRDLLVRSLRKWGRKQSSSISSRWSPVNRSRYTSWGVNPSAQAMEAAVPTA